MHLSIYTFFLSLFIALLSSCISPANAATLPHVFGKDLLRKQNDSPKATTVYGSDILQTYVCPYDNNLTKRQVVSIDRTINITIPIADIPPLLAQLQSILAQLENIVEAEGQLSTVPNTGVSSTLSTPSTRSTQISTLTATTTIKVTFPLMTNTQDTVNFLIRAPSDITLTSSSTTTPVITSLSSSSMTRISTTSTDMSANAKRVSPVDSACLNSVTTKETITTEAIVPQTSGSVDASGTSNTSAIVTSTTASVAASSSTTATPTGGEFFQTTSGHMSSIVSEATRSSHITTVTFSLVTSQATSDVTTTTLPAAATPYIFSAESSQNVAVYFGQTAVTGTTNLAAQCADPSIDIAILAFIISPSYSGKYPLVNFGAACGGQTAAMLSEAPGLLSCPPLAADIKTCQETYGKKVLLSIGGATASISFTAPSDASDFANMLWDLFGPPGNVDIDLRPFGNVTVDGFDVDNEDNIPTNWDVFGTALRTNYETAKHIKPFYISSAPQCSFPDGGVPMSFLQNCDFVWVQFYNDPSCQFNSTGFIPSIQHWSSELSASTTSTVPRLYLGAPAFSEAGPSAYAGIGSPSNMENIMHGVHELNLPNFGGVMFWDGPEGERNVEDGKSIIEWAKMGLVEV